MAEIYKVFEQARSKLEHSAPASLVGFYPLEVVKGWYHVKKIEIGLKGKGGFENETQRQSYILGLKSDLVDLTGSESKKHSFVGFAAFSLLEAAGYPMKPGTSVPNIDFDDLKYISLLDHLVAANIELREFELEVLGEKSPTLQMAGFIKTIYQILP